MSLTPRKTKSLTQDCKLPVVQKGAFHKVTDYGKATVHQSFTLDRVWTPGKDGEDGATFTRMTLSTAHYPSGPSVEPDRNRTKRRRKQLIYDSEPYQRKKIKRPQDTSFLDSMVSSCKLLAKVIFWTVSVGTAWYMYYAQPAVSHNLIWPVDDIELGLNNALFDQESAIQQIVTGIDLVIERPTSSIMILTGPVGVGKTTSASILQETFPWKNKMHLISAGLEFSWDDFVWNKLLNIRREPGLTLLVVDDCCKHPSRVLNHISFIVNQTQKVESKLLIVLIFTYRTDAERRNFFELVPLDLNYSEVNFKPLGRHTVKKCFLRELEKDKILVDEELLEKFIDRQMEVIEEVRAPPGCKSIETQVLQYKADLQRLQFLA